MARSVKIKTHEKEFMAVLEGGSAAGNLWAARTLRTYARQAVNRKYKKKLRKREREKTGKTHVITGASQPGEPPKRRSGRGRMSIDARRLQGGRGAKTWSSKRKAPYMSMWEFAPRNHPTRPQRPWLRPTFEKYKHELAKIMVTPIKKKLRKRRLR